MRLKVYERDSLEFQRVINLRISSMQKLLLINFEKDPDEI